MSAPSWFAQPQNGSDQADASAVMAAFDALDTISANHRTDAFRLLAARYEQDLRRMAAENASRTAARTAPS